MHELILYFYYDCPYCRRVLRTLKELDLEALVMLRNTRENEAWRQDLLRMNGTTQVPCLLIDGKPMLESYDIVQWLHQHFPKDRDPSPLSAPAV